MFCSFLIPYSVRYTLNFTATIITNVCDYLLKYLRLNNNNDNKFIDSSEECVWHVHLLHVWVSAFRLCLEVYTYIQLFVMMFW